MNLHDGHLALRRLVPDAPWKADAACRGMDPSLFFFDEDNHWTPEGVAQAKRVCEGCPVIAECREYGLAEKFGIFGGLTERERRWIRRRRGAA